MKKKQFKAESKKLLDLMINSIYTNKEIFLRELISNASDAIDKLYYESLTNKKIKVKKKDLEIRLIPDKKTRTLTIIDNGIGMNEEELENNLGTIAKSGSELFKEKMSDDKTTAIIGQFGVGFYSSFMVSDEVEVISKAYDSDKAYRWVSRGADGYSIEECDYEKYGTKIILHLKENNEDNNYDEYLEDYALERLVKKYSDYIAYPIRMEVETVTKKDDKEEKKTEDKTLNSMVPIWKKQKSSVKDEDYNSFYTDKFYDYEAPLKVIRSEVEGRCSYTTLLFIPSHAPYNYYSKDYEKGLELYSKGVLIMERCAELLPDYFSFVKGIVDSEDISLNISRETLQDNFQIKSIAKSLESKIKKELEKMLKNDRENYEKFFKDFGMQLKVGIYESFGMAKETLQDLLLFYSSKEKKMVTLSEYVSNMSDDDKTIYYACGETIDKIDLLPQVESAKEKGIDILYLTDYLDEFVFKVMMNYKEKNFVNIASSDANLETDEEKEELKKTNEEYKDMFKKMHEALNNGVNEVEFTHRLKNHPVCLTSKGDVSLEMQKVMDAMPTDTGVKATTVMEINENHPIADKLKSLYEKKDFETLEKYSKILYSEARLIEGMSLDNPTEISNLICELLAK